MKKYVAVLGIAVILAFVFSGCDLFEFDIVESDRERYRSRQILIEDEIEVVETQNLIETITNDTVFLYEDAVLYKSPDGRSERIGIIGAFENIEYISTKNIEGVQWYEIADGWFSIFEPTENNGRIISSGIAKETIQILSGPTDSAAEIGVYDPGSFIEINLLRGTWAQTERGWIVKDNIYIPGQMGTNNGWCLTLNYVDCYSEPNRGSAVVTTYSSLSRVRLYETISVDTVLWGCTDSGWIDLTYAYVEGTEGDGACHALVIDKTPLNVRVGPGTGYDIVRSLPVRSYVDVLFQLTSNGSRWGFVGDGWIYMDLVEIQ